LGMRARPMTPAMSPRMSAPIMATLYAEDARGYACRSGAAGTAAVDAGLRGVPPRRDRRLARALLRRAAGRRGPAALAARGARGDRPRARRGGPAGRHRVRRRRA